MIRSPSKRNRVRPGATAAILGPFPTTDGWSWVYRFYSAAAAALPGLREAARGYFLPARIERAQGGRLFRLLGVDRFGRWVPTGGASVRRLSGARMAPYTLAQPTPVAASDFFYRACIFEALHLTPMVLLFYLSALRLMASRADLALENLVINLLVNVYPILHHRHTRVRIVRLLERAAGRRATKDEHATDREKASSTPPGDSRSGVGTGTRVPVES